MIKTDCELTLSGWYNKWKKPLNCLGKKSIEILNMFRV